MRDATVMKNNLNKARTIMNRPIWINVDIWPSLCNHWASQAYKKRGYKPKPIEHLIVEGPFTLAALSPHLNINITWLSNISFTLFQHDYCTETLRIDEFFFVHSIQINAMSKRLFQKGHYFLLHYGLFSWSR